MFATEAILLAQTWIKEPTKTAEKVKPTSHSDIIWRELL